MGSRSYALAYRREAGPVMDIVILVVISLVVLVPVASLGWYRWRKMWEMRLEEDLEMDRDITAATKRLMEYEPRD